MYIYIYTYMYMYIPLCIGQADSEILIVMWSFGPLELQSYELLGEGFLVIPGQAVEVGRCLEVPATWLFL